ncbi:MAG: helix-turn-helix transcriptional regulator [Firmicutes bacterium]|nr:helix-turn-helix transcriptional regulator [Bacillota bacterium]
MGALGSRLRHRRRQLRLQQKDVAGKSGSSLLSKVENGASYPSLRNLEKWAIVLNTTMANLFGDQLILEAAKETILLTETCHAYLDLLNETSLTRFLRELSSSASSLSTPVPKPPLNPEAEYLTARVLLQRGTPQKAAVLLEKALATNNSQLWRIYHLLLLCQIYEQLSDNLKLTQARKKLALALNSLDARDLELALPPGNALSPADLGLLKLSAFWQAFQAHGQSQAY